MSIELYINKKICDIRNPLDFSIRLRRSFLNPEELNTKDAQGSYKIDLPATSRNNEVFGFKNVEEIKGKFRNLFDAYLTIGGIKIFEGQFNLTKVTKLEYTGELVILAQRGVNNLFGDRTMNKAGDWIIPFGEFSESVSQYNNMVNAPCIFPYVMYGLLPKSPVDGKFTLKDVWDSSVMLDLDDFPPSINCLQTIQQIFKNEGLNISGSAFADQRLNQLYMSYKNPSDYEMLWNYGKLGVVKLEGSWISYDTNINRVERKVSINQKELDNNRKVYAVDIFNSTNSAIFINEDSGNNVTTTLLETEDNIPYRSVTFTVPYSGLYKVKFGASITLNKTPGITTNQNVRVISPVSRIRDLNTGDYIVKTEDFSKRRFEVKLMRNWGTGNVERTELGYDRSFYRNNLDQDDNFDSSNSANYPKYFPLPDEVVFIDPLQNPNLVCGVSFGANYGKNNPLDIYNLYCNPIAIKHGRSWSGEADSNKRSQSAVYNSGYMRWGETPEGEIDFWTSDRFKVDLLNTNTYTKTENDYTSGNGNVEQIIWLNQGERLTVCAVSDEGEMDFQAGSITQTYKGMLIHGVSYTLDVEPYRTTNNWLLMDEFTNSSIGTMDWNDTDRTDSFYSDGLNLTNFLPIETKIDDWIDNFCKAFNLLLTRLENGTFELNVKQTTRAYSTTNPINLDKRGHVDQRENTPLNLPSAYEVGFTVNKDEQGYISTIEKDSQGNIIRSDDGGGIFYTGNFIGNPITQTSTFSHNWYKNIRFEPEGVNYDFPIITDKEIWENPTASDYEEMMKKDYINSPQRFWYKGDNIQVSGFGKERIETTLVKSVIDNTIELNYQNKPFSILRNYFTIFTNNDGCYTVLDVYLKPDEYNRLPYTMIVFNGDLYYAAKIDGYDPMLRNKATLSLIRKLS